MSGSIPVYIGDGAIEALLSYCAGRGLTRFLLVCDQNTYPAFGKAVEEALLSANYDVVKICLAGKEVIADEHYLVKVLLSYDGQERVFLAVGSGTITDIARLVSFKTKSEFISLPTAASVDGYLSSRAPLVVGGFKNTYKAQAPVALFADLPVLCAAPGILSAAGFGDMVGKYLSLADWRLGCLLWGERYDDAIAARTARAVENCVRLAGGICEGQPEAIGALMHSLVESGLCMLEFGSSAPASGAEHHLSHYWEMRLLREGRPAIFHGLKVGVASVISAGWYAELRGLKRNELPALLDQARLMPIGSQIELIHRVYGEAAEEIIATQEPFLTQEYLSAEEMKARILAKWDEVLEIARQVPEPGILTSWLQMAGCPTSATELGLGEGEVHDAFAYSHYLRPRYTINKLRQYLFPTRRMQPL